MSARSGRRRSSSTTRAASSPIAASLAYILEGHLMLAEGVPPAMIENAGKQAGMPVGPLSLNDEVGVDLGAQDREGHEGAGRRGRDRARAGRAPRPHGRDGGAPRPQEPEGLLRLSGERAQAPLAGTSRLAGERTSTARPSTCRSSSARLLVDAGARSGAHLRGRGHHRSARGRCRLDPGFRLRALHGRRPELHRFHGRAGRSSNCAERLEGKYGDALRAA